MKTKSEAMDELLSADPDRTGTIRIPLEAGGLMRRQLRGALEQCRLAFDLDEYDWEESKGFLESTFYIKASGRVGELQQLVATVLGWTD
jgi:hypothetical protein